MKKLLLLLVLPFVWNNLSAQDPDTTITLDSTVLEVRQVADSLEIPWDMVWGPDERIWFTERNGKVKRLDLSTDEVVQLLQVDDIFESPDNSGMHGMTLHPNFPMPAHVYVHYTFGLYSSKILRYTYDEAEDTLVSPEEIIPFLNAHDSHNGSRFQWGEDGKLFFCIGDAYTYLQFPQDVAGSNNGKVLRMNADGSVPSDNPISGSLVWSWGHRNPQGLVFGPNGKLYLSEHGPETDDELNLIKEGHNYGWPYVRGYCDNGVAYIDGVLEEDFCNDSNVVEPIAAWTPTQAPCGLDYYDHPAIPEWDNTLLLCFLKQSHLKSLKLDGSGDNVTEELDHLSYYYGRLRDVLVAPNGKVYICTSNSDQAPPGQIYDKIFELMNPAFTIGIDKSDNLSEEDVSIRPNPTVDRAFVQLPNLRETVDYQIIDVNGRIVASESVLSTFSGFELERSGLNAGVYLVRINTSLGSVLKKVVFN